MRGQGHQSVKRQTQLSRLSQSAFQAISHEDSSCLFMIRFLREPSGSPWRHCSWIPAQSPSREGWPSRLAQPHGAGGQVAGAQAAGEGPSPGCCPLPRPLNRIAYNGTGTQAAGYSPAYASGYSTCRRNPSWSDLLQLALNLPNTSSFLAPQPSRTEVTKH